MAIEIRQTSLEKAVAIWKQIPEFDESGTAEAQAAEKLPGKTTLFLDAIVEGKPAGFLIGYDKPDGSFYLWMIGVLPPFRRKGILKQLFSYAQEWAGERGFSKLSITTRNNRREMLSFLVKQGFNFTSVDAREKIGDNRIHAEKTLL